MKEIVFVTGSEHKYIVAKRWFDKAGFKLKRVKMDCPEIQDMDVANVASFSAEWASKKLGKAVIKSDQGFYIEGLKGFPGAYMHDAERKIDAEGFYRLMKGVKNRKAKFVEALVYCEHGKKPKVFIKEIKGKLIDGLRGSHGLGVDYMFIPAGESKTVSQLPKERYHEMYDFNTWPLLIKHLKNKRK